MTKSKQAATPMVTRKKITIAYQVKGMPTTKVVEAEIIGPLAVHPTVNEQEFWTVTHVETGHALYRFINAELEAIIIAKKLAGHHGWDGNREEIQANLELKREVAAVLRVHGIMVKS